MKPISVRALFSIHAEKLALTWIAGERGGDRLVTADVFRSQGGRVLKDDIITPEAQPDSACHIAPSQALVGHLNLIHPNQVQVLGYTEVQYLMGLREISREDVIRQLLGHQPACIIVAEDQMIPEQLKKACERTRTPLLRSAISSNKITDDLRFYLTALLAEVVTLHGVYLEVITIGVLLTGKPGVGKSELALELITRGHRLVADDAPEFSLIAPDTIKGTASQGLHDFLEVRGLGIINVRELFGAGAVKSEKFLRLIIALERLDSDRFLKLDRLQGSYRTRSLLGVEVPEITLPVAPGRNLAVLVECATRNHILRMSGYNATEDFMARSVIEPKAL